MPESELTLHALGNRLLGELPVAEPPADLWPRIASAQRSRSARGRLRRRIMTTSGAAAIVIASGFWVVSYRQHEATVEIDWQARAQALELQLRALDVSAATPIARLSPEAFDELSSLDASLQSAYDNSADSGQLKVLWKRRSELLRLLLQARQQNVEISRI